MSKTGSPVFATRLRAARQRLGIPQDKLGVAIGIDEGAASARISRYETGDHEPKFDIAVKLAKKLKVPVAYLYCPEDAVAELLLEVADLDEADIASLIKSAQRKKG